MAVLLALTSSACGGGTDSSADPTTTAPAPTTTATPTTTTAASTTTAAAEPNSPEYEAFRAAPTACGADKPDPLVRMQFDEPADQGLDPATPVRVTLETSCGDLELELDPGLAPIAVNSFVFLARQGYYDGSASHRIMEGFMFQAGDPLARGTGRPGYVLPVDEWPEPGFAYTRGVVAMANGGPGTTGSQFFIMLGDRPLQPNFTVLGRVVAGEQVLDAIAAVPVTLSARGEPSLPVETLYIERVVVGG